jgi:hypothetical protein
MRELESYSVCGPETRNVQRDNEADNRSSGFRYYRLSTRFGEVASGGQIFIHAVSLKEVRFATENSLIEGSIGGSAVTRFR